MESDEETESKNLRMLQHIHFIKCESYIKIMEKQFRNNYYQQIIENEERTNPDEQGNESEEGGDMMIVAKNSDRLQGSIGQIESFD